MSEHVRARRLRRAFALFLASCISALQLTATARADDGYDAQFARAVRAATDIYRLQLWAQQDGYVQSTEYVDHVGIMFTNHERFNPIDLAHPTVLIFDLAGRLVACEYQFVDNAALPAAFAPVPAGAWFPIPRHVHYNVKVNGRIYYAQEEWPTTDPPTADNLRKRSLIPADATLLFSFVHPKTRAVIVWAWLPNVDGLFAGENALLP